MYSPALFKFISIAAGFMACGYAFWRGGKPERLAAALILADWVLSPALVINDTYNHMQIAVFAIDGLLMFALISIALRSDRFWPLWATAFQLLELLMHIAMLVDHTVRPRAYYVGMEISSYLILASLALGAWLEAPRQVHGRDALAS